MRRAFITLAILMAMSSSATAQSAGTVAEVLVSADTINIDQDLLNSTLQNNCHPVDNISTKTHSVDYNYLIQDTGLGQEDLSLKSFGLAGSLNTRILGIESTPSMVVIHFVDLKDNKRFDYYLGRPVQLTFNLSRSIDNFNGEHVGEYTHDFRIMSRTLSKTTVAGVVDDASDSGYTFDVACEGNQKTFNLFVAKQLHLQESQSFFDALATRTVEVTVK